MRCIRKGKINSFNFGGNKMERIKSFYISETNDIRPELFNDYAESVAKCFASKKEFVKKDGSKGINRSGVTSTQLRRLFDEVKSYKRIIKENNKKSWNEQYPYIKMIKAKTHYTIARAKKNDKKNSEYYDNVLTFISEGIDLIHTYQDYSVFVALFESVYGYYYENRPDNNN